jgi:general secretion pathway protein B
MSYILDALKRADAERGQPAGVVSTDAQPHALRLRPPAPWWRSGIGVLALGAALVGIAALTALWWPSAEVAIPVASAPEPTPVTVETPAPPPVPVPVPPPAVAADAQGRPVPILMPERPVAPRPAEAASSTAFGPDPVPTMPAAVTRKPEPSPTPPPPPPARPAAAPSVPVASTAPASAPPVKVTGATYSDNPAHRMLIVNGKIVLEGQQIEPGLTLEVITPHSAVLNHQGSRYNINY